MPKRFSSKDARGEWLHEREKDGFKTHLEGRIWNITKGVATKKANILCSPGGWFHVGKSYLVKKPARWVDLFIFICGDSRNYYVIPIEKMLELAKSTKIIDWDKRPEFNINPLKHLYRPGGDSPEREIDISGFYRNLSFFQDGSDMRAETGKAVRVPWSVSTKEKVMFANISWNPYTWTRPFKDKNAPFRYVQKYPGHESLNFDFNKGGIDDTEYVYGFAQFANAPVRFANDSLVFFYSRNYPGDGKGYIVGLYGDAQLVTKTASWPGFEKERLSLNLRAKKSLSLRFPVYLPSSKYIDTRVGQVGFKYGTIEDAEKILLDEYNECVKKGDPSCFPQLTKLYTAVTGKFLPPEANPAVTIQKSIAGTEIEVEDETATTDKQKLIDAAKSMLDFEDGEAVTTRPPIDTSGLYKETSDYTGPITGNPHVKLELATKIGRKMNLHSTPLVGCSGGIVYLEEGYDGIRTDEQIVKFNARIRKIMEAIKGSSDGPNPDNIRIMVTHASTDAKLLPKDGIIGFNVVNDSESDAFWVMAAAREVSYLKRSKWYQHLRLMTELVVHAFGSLDLISQTSAETQRNP